MHDVPTQLEPIEERRAGPALGATRVALDTTPIAGAPSLSEISNIRAVNAQLEATIQAMRAQLENQRIKAESNVQAVKAGLAGEIAELKTTVNEMRRKLQELAESGDAAVQAVRASAAAEISQLRSTINMLRTELEAAKHSHRNQVADLEAAFARERKSLEEHIKALRAIRAEGS